MLRERVQLYTLNECLLSSLRRFKSKVRSCHSLVKKRAMAPTAWPLSQQTINGKRKLRELIGGHYNKMGDRKG